MAVIIAAAYIRVSRGCQYDPLGPHEARCEYPILENQRQKVTDYIARRGFGTGKQMVYEDIRSGKDDDRPGWNALLKAVTAGKVHLVVFTALSRMSREGQEGATAMLYVLERAGCGFHFTDLPIINYDDTTNPIVRKVIFTFITEYDKSYREGISKATKDAFARKRALNPDWKGPGRPKKHEGCDVLRGYHTDKCRKTVPPATTRLNP